MASRHQHKWLILWRYTRSLLLGIPAGEGPPPEPTALTTIKQG